MYMLLDYATTYPNAIVHYKANNMFLHADSDAAHVTIPEARICYAGHFYMNYWPSPSPIKPNPKRNGPIHMEWETIRNDVSPTAESETYGTFNNRKTDIGMQPAWIKLDHGQPATPQFYDRRICKLGDETKTFKKKGIWNGTGWKTKRCLSNWEYIGK